MALLSPGIWLAVAVLAGGCSYDLDALRGTPSDAGAADPSGADAAGGDAGAAADAAGERVMECDEIAQSGCRSSPPEKCSICARADTASTRGCSAAGAKAAGMPCAQDSECAPGTQCWNADSGPTFVCRKLCKRDADCVPAEPRCKLLADYECYYLEVKASFGLCY